MAQRKPENTGEFNDLLCCVICFEPFTRPKMLRCGHSFCEGCLQGYYKVSQSLHTATPGKLSCPTCREVITIPEIGICGFPNDFKANKLESLFRKMTICTHTPSNLCGPCQSKKLTVSATAFCSTCRQNYCSECLAKHDKVFGNHKVLKTATMELKCKVGV